MHRTISIKHRIVRRVDIDKAPLATFDTVDLGDEDDRLTCSLSESNKSTCILNDSSASHHLVDSNKSGVFIQDGGLKSGTIGGSNSKKSLSQAGGEEKESKDDRVKDKSGCSEVENVQEGKQSKSAVAESLTSDPRKLEALPIETATVTVDIDKSVGKDVPKTSVVTTLARQTTIGRVNIPIKKQDSDSSSSSPGSCSDTTFNFQASRPSVGQFEKTCAEGRLLDSELRKECLDNLTPDYLDPSQILSPSKRKAYERRIERLKVTTSPIARPRSAAPINVISLDEYAAISSPEPSPATPSVQDKLKITLPLDEFTSKLKTPKLHSAKRQNSDDNCFEFTEEFLFSRTKSALVVTEDGQLPLSPRRVLIPPNLTPSTSPQLSSSPRLSPISFLDPTSADSHKLIYIQQSETVHKIFGESEEEDWAHFPECSQADDSAEHDTSTSTVCDAQENDLDSSILTDQLQDWTTTSYTDSCPASETLPVKSSNYQLDILAEQGLHSQVCDAHPKTEISFGLSDQSRFNLQEVSKFGKFESEFELPNLSESNICSPNVTLNSITPFSEVPIVQINPDFESEEIITIEINQSPTGREKHIGIEIRSGSNSQSASPVCFDQSIKSCSPDSESPFVIFNEASNIQQDYFIQSHSNSEVVNPAPFFCTSNDSIPTAASYYQERQPCLTSDSSLWATEQSIHRAPEAQLHFSSPFDVLIPQNSQPRSVTHTAASALLSHPQQHNEQQIFNDKPELRQRPPSTNPFDIDFQSPECDRFDLGLHLQSVHTNPFLEQSSSVSTDLFLFSSSMDNSSA